MKFRMILSTLLLPAVVAAQQTTVKPTLPYRVIAIQGPVASAPTDLVPPADTAQNDTPALLQGSPATSGLTSALPQEKAQGYQYILPAGSQTVSRNTLFADSEQSKVRVNLNLRNAPLKEAIKQLSEQTKREFVLEADAPADARVTIVAKNIRLNTALDMLTDATELNWNQQADSRANGKSVVLIYHLGKKIARNWWEPGFLSPYINTAVPLDANGNSYWNGQNNTRWNFLFNPQNSDSGQTLKVTPSPKGNQNFDIGTNVLGVSPYTNSSRVGTTLRQGQPNNLSADYSYVNTLIGATNTTEVRSTFTCPHCKHQVTVIHKHESPKCEKCGRVFHDDWQFCPFDGTKRPADTDTDWQFCPICGERIKLDGKPETKPKEGKADTNNGRAAGVGN